MNVYTQTKQESANRLPLVLLEIRVRSVGDSRVAMEVETLATFWLELPTSRAQNFFSEA